MKVKFSFQAARRRRRGDGVSGSSESLASLGGVLERASVAGGVSARAARARVRVASAAIARRRLISLSTAASLWLCAVNSVWSTSTIPMRSSGSRMCSPARLVTRDIATYACPAPKGFIGAYTRLFTVLPCDLCIVVARASKATETQIIVIAIDARAARSRARDRPRGMSRARRASLLYVTTTASLSRVARGSRAANDVVPNRCFPLARLPMPAATRGARRETLERGGHHELSLLVRVHGARLRRRDHPERARLLVSQVRLHHGAAGEGRPGASSRVTTSRAREWGRRGTSGAKTAADERPPPNAWDGSAIGRCVGQCR